MTATAEKTIRIGMQTYRLGEMVIFATNPGRWQMHEPHDWDEPIISWKVGSESYHRTLRDACAAFHMRKRAERMANAAISFAV